MNLHEQKAKLEQQLSEVTEKLKLLSFDEKLLRSKIKKLDKVIEQANEVLK